jgi:hypothetical protein
MFCSIANAQILLKAPDVADSAVTAVLREHPQAVPFSTWWFHQRELASEGPRLNEQFERAEDEYLHANLKSAAMAYKVLADGRTRYDWAIPQRKKILTALLRLVSLEKDPVLRRRDLRDAVNFDALLDPDPEIFPPPLIEEFKAARAKNSWTSIDTMSWPKDIVYILINGRRVHRTDTIHIPSTSFRLTVVGDSFLPNSRVIKVEDVAHLHFDLQFFVSGHCADPHWDLAQTQYPPHALTVFSENCAIDSTTPPLKPLTMASLPPADFAISTPPPVPESKHKSILESPWFWVAVGSVVGGFVIYRQTQQHSSGPTSKEGF